MKEKTCAICGKTITRADRRKYCSQACADKGKRAHAREWQRKARIKRKRNTVPKDGEGYEDLAQAIVLTAIEDIRACRVEDIKRFEDPTGRIRSNSAAMWKYFDAKSFLLSERMTSLSEASGREILRLLLTEKEKE